MRIKKMLTATLACVWGLCALHGHASSPDDVYDLVMLASSSKTWEAIKYHRQTGEAWTAWNGAWIKIIEEEDPPEGSYTIKMTALSNNWAALRFDVRTGRTWQCLRGTWTEITLRPPTPEDEAAGTDPPSLD